MAEKFDPYYKWLGIPPRDQPPNRYRLLGIELFEPDREVIDAAANRVMAYLKELAVGDNAAHSQHLLNEIARARLCLLNPKKKEAYDHQLRGRLAESGPAESPPPRSSGPPLLKPPQSPPPTAPPRSEPPRDAPPRLLTDRDSLAAAPPIRDSGILAEAVPPAGPAEPVADPAIVSHPRRRRRGPSPLYALGVVAVAVCLCVVLLILTLLRIGGPDRGTGSDGSDAAARATLVLALDNRERSEITEFILDGRSLPVPPRKSYSLAPGPHRVVLSRTGYLDVADSFVLGEASRYVIRVRWQSEPQGTTSRGELPALDLSFGASSDR